MLKQSWIIGGSTGSTQLSPRRAGFATLTRRTCQNTQFSMTKIKWIDPESSSTTVPNKIYLKESWIASLSLAMTILKIRSVIAKECICTTVAIHFCYLILFFLPHSYFPMQKWSKMLFNISSVMTSPVISSRASNDAFKSI